MDSVLTHLFTSDWGTVGTSDFLLRLLVAWLATTAVGWFYSWSHGSLSYSQNFVQSLVLLGMVVAVVLAVVGDSLARAFGLGAALAIVRFRTPVKDARDAVFLFLSVAIGMASGSGMLHIAMSATVMIGLVSMFLHWSAFGTRSAEQGVLRLHFAGDDTGREAVAGAIRKHCRSFQLAAARKGRADGPEELVYDVNLRDPSGADVLVRELSATLGVSGVALLPTARVGEA
ncbi:MAG: DUF4956 domain-containing protein [Alphaproteobacteria bacterium]|nr:DUF4956 domain-containing protein [Alphaproteobacteria bacterium]